MKKKLECCITGDVNHESFHLTMPPFHPLRPYCSPTALFPARRLVTGGAQFRSQKHLADREHHIYLESEFKGAARDIHLISKGHVHLAFSVCQLTCPLCRVELFKVFNYGADSSTTTLAMKDIRGLLTIRCGEECFTDGHYPLYPA